MSSLRRTATIAAILVIAVASLAPPMSGAMHTGPARASTAPLGEFRKRVALRHVRRLAGGIGVRVRATRGERRGQRYVAGRLRALGYRVFVQRFSVDAGTSRNVIARWPGARRYPVVVGGHVDTVAGSPGANDNASGIGTMLEVARLVAGRPQARWVVFASFGSEEYGSDGVHHVGSQVFVNRLGAKGRRRLAAMLSVDMVGRTVGGRAHIVGTAGIGPPAAARTVLRKARRAGVRVAYRTTCDCSDNGPFERAGIPAAFLWSGSEPNYHSPRDRFRNVRPKSVGRAGRIVRAFVSALDRRLVTRLRRS